MSDDLNKFVRQIAEINAMQDVSRAARAAQESKALQERSLEVEKERLDIERRKSALLEDQIRDNKQKQLKIKQLRVSGIESPSRKAILLF